MLQAFVMVVWYGILNRGCGHENRLVREKIARYDETNGSHACRKERLLRR